MLCLGEFWRHSAVIAPYVHYLAGVPPQGAASLAGNASAPPGASLAGNAPPPQQAQFMPGYQGGYKPPGYSYSIEPVPVYHHFFGVPVFGGYQWQIRVKPPSPAPNVTPNLGSWPDATP